VAYVQEQQVAYVQPAMTTTVTEAAAVHPALSGPGATLLHAFYHPASSASTTYTAPASYATGGTVTYPAGAVTYPAAGVSTAPTAQLSAAHTYLPAHPTVGMYTGGAHSYTTDAAGYTSTYAAAPLVNAGGTGYTNNYVVAHGGAGGYVGSSGPTLYGTDPGVLPAANAPPPVR
jgi:hypothetical protein